MNIEELKVFECGEMEFVIASTAEEAENWFFKEYNIKISEQDIYEPIGVIDWQNKLIYDEESGQKIKAIDIANKLYPNGYDKPNIIWVVEI